MKNINQILGFITMLLFIGCTTDRKIETISIQLLSNKPLASKADAPLPPVIKEFISPFEVGDSLVYVFDVSVKRLDMPIPKETKIIVPTNWAGENLSKPLGIYAYSDMKQDYEEQIPNMKLGVDLTALSKKQFGDLPLVDATYLEDSTQSGQNTFTSVQKLKEYLVENYESKKTKNSFIVGLSEMVAPTPNINCQPILNRLKEYLQRGDWEKAVVSTKELVSNGCATKTLADSIIKKGDYQFQSVKNSNTLQMIDVAMGYYASAYPIGVQTQKDYIKTKYKACEDLIKKNGGSVKIIPSLPISN